MDRFDKSHDYHVLSSFRPLDERRKILEQNVKDIKYRIICYPSGRTFIRVNLKRGEHPCNYALTIHV